MGCCASSTLEDGVDFEDLRRQVEGLPTKREREAFVIHFLTLFDEAKGGSRYEALATLANVIRIVDNTK